MDSSILNKQGITLLEVVATMVIVGFLLSIIIPFNVTRIKNAQYQKTVAEMKTIAQAAIDYYISQGSCPTTTDQLAPTYTPKAVTSSPFGTAYQISCANNLVSVTNQITAGLVQKNPGGSLLEVTTAGGFDTIKITQRIPNELTGRLLYDKKYLYGQ